MKPLIITLLFALLLPQLALQAQHHPQHHQQPATDTVPAEMPAMDHSQHEQMDGNGMFSAYSLSLPIQLRPERQYALYAV